MKAPSPLAQTIMNFGWIITTNASTPAGNLHSAVGMIVCLTYYSCNVRTAVMNKCHYRLYLHNKRVNSNIICGHLIISTTYVYVL